jgi:hypothetical protein
MTGTGQLAGDAEHSVDTPIPSRATFQISFPPNGEENAREYLHHPLEVLGPPALFGDPGRFAIASARASWPRCRAFARSTGKPCRAAGDGVHGLCRNHTGLVLRRAWRPPLPLWWLLVTGGGVWLAPDRAARTRRKETSWPQRVSWSIAVRLVTGRQVTRAVFHREEGRSLVREVEHCGGRVVTEGADGLIHRVRFEVDDPEASTWLARRRAERRSDG